MSEARFEAWVWAVLIGVIVAATVVLAVRDGPSGAVPPEVLFGRVEDAEPHDPDTFDR